MNTANGTGDVAKQNPMTSVEFSKERRR